MEAETAKVMSIHSALLKLIFMVKCILLLIPMSLIAFIIFLLFKTSAAEDWPTLQANIINSEYEFRHEDDEEFNSLVIFFDYHFEGLKYVGRLDAEDIVSYPEQSNPRLAIGRKFDIKIDPDEATDVYIEYLGGSMMMTSLLVSGNLL